MTERWAYLGPEGTFTEQAVREMAARADHSPELIPLPGVSAVIGAMRTGQVSAACVPMENSVEGAVPLTQDELTHGEPVMIAAEAYVPVTFDLLGRPGTELAAVRSVGSHPHGHAQVRDWLAANLPDAQPVDTPSTAAAAAGVAAGDLDAAAAAPLAGERYGLVTVVADIGAVRDAQTRFVLLRPPGAPPPATGNDRTTIILSVANRPGSLLEVLTEFAARGINMTRLESRPTRTQMGEYVFHVDADGHVTDPAMADMLAALRRRSALLRYLGSYPRASGSTVTPPDFATRQAYDDAAAAVMRLQRGESG